MVGAHTTLNCKRSSLEQCSIKPVVVKSEQQLSVQVGAASFKAKSRPTRESVLKRLYEALMRRSLTKIDLSQRDLRPSDAKLVKMALLQNANLSVLKLGYNNLGNRGIEILAGGIVAHKNLKSLDLGFNRFGDEGCRALAYSLKGSSIMTLYLAGNLFGEDGAIAISDAIAAGCSLSSLHLTGNRLGPAGVIAITSAILENELQQRSGLKELFLGGTSMGSGGCQAVARMLGRSSTIEVISLANCGITDEEVSTIATSIKENRSNLPLQSLQLSFNEITCKGLDSLTNALWGSRKLRELMLDNNNIGERGGHQLSNILPHIRTLEVLDVGFNSIRSSGMSTLMKTVAITHHLLSLSVSGNPIDTTAARSVAYALAYNQSLNRIFLDHCEIEREGQRHIVAGVVSNSGISLRKLTGFRIGPVIVTIGLPSAMESWTNEQILNFVGLMWEQRTANIDEKDDREFDPLHFLPETNGEGGGGSGIAAPIDACTVVEVAKQAYHSLGDYGENVFKKSHNYQDSFESPVTKDAIIIESVAAIDHQKMQHNCSEIEECNEKTETNIYVNEKFVCESEILVPRGQANSFVASPSEPAIQCIPDPARKKKIVDWLYQNIQSLNRLSQLHFDSGALWRLHQHYFSPVVNESGGSANDSQDTVNITVSSVPNTKTGACAASISTQSSNATAVLQSDPVMPPIQNSEMLPMLKRKVSYRFLGEAVLQTNIMALDARSDYKAAAYFNGKVAKMIEDGTSMHSMPPKTKRARRNKTRISFLPRIKEKLDGYLDACHEKALILMRQLYFVESALLQGRVNPQMPPDHTSTHLCGILASEAEMILVDMM